MSHVCKIKILILTYKKYIIIFTTVQSNGTEITKTVPEYMKMKLSKFVLKQITLPPKNENSHLFKSYKVLFYKHTNILKFKHT